MGAVVEDEGEDDAEDDEGEGNHYQHPCVESSKVADHSIPSTLTCKATVQGAGAEDVGADAGAEVVPVMGEVVGIDPKVPSCSCKDPTLGPCVVDKPIECS